MGCRPGEGLGLAPAARRMYLINCLAAMQRTLAQHDCAASRADALGQVSGLHATHLSRCSSSAAPQPTQPAADATPNTHLTSTLPSAWHHHQQALMHTRTYD